MVTRVQNSFLIFSSVVLQLCGLHPPAVAAPKTDKVIFTPPVGAAKSIQVTEVFSEAALSESRGIEKVGPLHRSATVTIQLQPPDDPYSRDWHFRVDCQERNPAKPASYCVADGKTEVFYEDGEFRSEPRSPGTLFVPLEEFLVRINEYRIHHSPEVVSAVPAMRDGKTVLLVRDPMDSQVPQSKGKKSKVEQFEKRMGLSFGSEDWYDPKTHLLLRRAQFLTLRGKTHEVMRTEYSGWVLNAPLPASLFVIPSAAAKGQ